VVMRRRKLQVAAASRSCTNLGPGRRMVGAWTGGDAARFIMVTSSIFK
jgi:hypothetical protein